MASDRSLCRCQKSRLNRSSWLAPRPRTAKAQIPLSGFVDVTVRNIIQVDPSKIKINRWQSALQDLLQNVCVGLVIDDTGVRADLYKILMYETGGHFKAHQDSEKALGMFGTLVTGGPVPVVVWWRELPGATQRRRTNIPHGHSGLGV